MRNHYRTTLDHEKLKQIGLLSHDFVAEGVNFGLPTSFTHYSDKPLTPEQSQDLCLFRGINQTQNTLTLEIKVGAIIQLHSPDPKALNESVFIEFHPNYWSVYAKGGELAQKQTTKQNRTRFMVPLMPPLERQVVIGKEQLRELGMIPENTTYSEKKHRISSISICTVMHSPIHDTIVPRRYHDSKAGETFIGCLDSFVLRLTNNAGKVAFILTNSEGYVRVGPQDVIDSVELPVNLL